ncbi:MAG: hypothetical protein AAFO03_16950 [Bacteroidota bacterium]
MWASTGSDYWGTWLLTKELELDVQDMFVSPINSNDIQRVGVSDYYPFWSRHFLKELLRGDTPLVGSGKWRLVRSEPQLSAVNSKYDFIFDIEDAFPTSSLRWISWDLNGSRSLIGIKKSPAENSGRVKWYRKLVRAGSCPPILVWLFSAIDAYVILDGHDRLSAFQLEKQPPKFLILRENIVLERKPSVQRQQSIEKAIKHRNSHRYKRPLRTDEINKLLVNAYDDRPILNAITRAKYENRKEAEWHNEVLSESHQMGSDQALIQMMIERETHEF